MRPYQIATLTVVLVASVLGVPPHAYPGQTAQPPTQPDFRGAVDLVEVSVIVTEADGSPVRDLAIDDFEVSEDGDLQPVLTFAHVDIPRDAFDEPGSRPRSGVTSNTQGGREGRVYLLLLDDLHTNPLRTDTVRAIGRQFVEDHLMANDLAAIATTSGQPPRLPLTSNRQRLFEALDRFLGRDEAEPAGVGSTWNTGGVAGAPPGFAQDTPLRSIADFAERTYTDMEQEVARKAQIENARIMLRSLEGFAGWMADVDARRKAIILVGQGIDYDTTVLADFDAKTLPDEILWASAAAARHDVTVYAIDPRGLPTGESSSIPTVSLIGESPFSSAEVRAKQSLRGIAEETGGVAFIDSNQFGEAFDRIVRDSSAYYLLGYRPPRDAPDNQRHQIRVRVNRSDVTVRARRSYIDTPDPSGPPGPDDIAAQLVAMLESPMLQRGLRLDLAAVPFRSEPDMAEVVVAVQVSRTLSGDPNGFGEVIDVAVVATDPSGAVLAERRTEVALSQEARTTGNERGLRAVLRLPVEAPGPVQLRAAVIDRSTGARGSVHHELDVPDLHAGVIAMSGVGVGASPADATPASDSDAVWSPRRVFTIDDTLDVVAEVYLNGPHTRRDLDITCTIRGDDGTLWFQTQEDRSPADAVEPFRASFPLWDLSPGAYTLSLEAGAGEEAPRISRQIGFSVTRP